jgi:hypothetical protein
VIVNDEKVKREKVMGIITRGHDDDSKGVVTAENAAGSRALGGWSEGSLPSHFKLR